MQANGTTVNASGEDNGETVLFWVDLSTAHLIDGGFSTAQLMNYTNLTTTSTPGFNAFFPAAKLGSGNYVYVWSGWGKNFYSISALTSITTDGVTYSNASMTVNQAYSIDKKIDDGVPMTGGVTAQYLNGGPQWPPANGGYDNGQPYTTYVAGSPYTCFDNGGASNASQQYSLAQNTNNVNCVLTFQFQ